MAGGEGSQEQRVFVMRHGERLDGVYNHRDWWKTAKRPYDTPLSSHGHAQTPKLVQQRLVGKGISVVVSSPFLRCLQTASHAYQVLGLDGLHVCNLLCEMLLPQNRMQGQPEVPALEDAGDINILSLGNEDFPSFPESKMDCLVRYRNAVDVIADKYWPLSVLIVTHQTCVEEAAKWGGKKEDVEATYAAHVELRRTSRDGHDWKWCGDKGVYTYDSVF